MYIWFPDKNPQAPDCRHNTPFWCIHKRLSEKELRQLSFVYGILYGFRIKSQTSRHSEQSQPLLYPFRIQTNYNMSNRKNGFLSLNQVIGLRRRFTAWHFSRNTFDPAKTYLLFRAFAHQRTCHLFRDFINRKDAIFWNNSAQILEQATVSKDFLRPVRS